MIPESSRYYGCVIDGVLDAVDSSISFRRLHSDVPGFFLVNERIPLHVKYSTARTGPWAFNFHSSHRLLQRKSASDYGECVVALVCGRDGVAALRNSELEMVLETNVNSQENVTVRRGHRKMFEIKGRNGVYDKKVARGSLQLLFSTLLTEAE